MILYKIEQHYYIARGAPLYEVVAAATSLEAALAAMRLLKL